MACRRCCTAQLGVASASSSRAYIHSAARRRVQLPTSSQKVATASPSAQPSLSSVEAARRLPSQRSLSSSATSGASNGSNRNRTNPKDSEKDSWARHRTQYNYDPFTLHPSESHLGFPLVTADDLAKSSSRPRGVRMLARDFIHDSLYNPHYGYFSKQAVLLPEGQRALASAASSDGSDAPLMERPERFDFSSMRSESDFMRAVQSRYMDFEQRVESAVEAKEEEEQEQKAATAAAAKGTSFAEQERAERKQRRQGRKDDVPVYSAAGLEAAQQRGRMLARKASEGVQEKEVQTMAAKQVWHTPTQIFQPFYARAIARYLVAEYKLQLYPYDDLVVYELGAGSGALAHDILDYLMDEEPEIYQRTRYRIVEISERLAEEQQRRLKHHVDRGTVEVVHRSFLQWNEDVPEPCFVIALEVLDNLTHDVVRYSTSTLEPYQAIVSIDETGDIHELWQPVSDPLIKRYLSLLHSIYPSSRSLPLAASTSPLHRLLPPGLRSKLIDYLPFYPNLTKPHYLPTGSLQMMDVLRRHFPHHRLVMSDFDVLPEACDDGIDAPVVQTRFRGSMVPVTTYLVLQGYFDIFFPTDFRTLKEVYTRVLNGQEEGSRRRRGGWRDATTATTTSTPLLNDDYFTGYRHLNNSVIPSAGGAGGGAAGGGGATTTRGGNTVRLYSHAEFLERYAETDAVRLKDGSNPMLSWYANASWFLS